ncbi:MAG TPA: cytochrome P450 [Candidatus Sulfotelmatobacter sp.]|nr:cytochrome P450 [Candidatus Sulfotelmatobacter sp.]
MTPETAWAEAMKFENRANPYPFFDELRKTPVVHVGNGLYVVTGYRELMALAHDPRISSDTRRLKARAAGSAGADPALEAYGEHGSMIVADPPEHDRNRRQAMRHFGPPHTTELIPNTGPEISKLCNDLLDKAKGKTRVNVVDDYAYPVPVMVICKILGVPLKDELQFHVWIHDFMAGMMDMGPEVATEEGKARAAKGKESAAALLQYLTDLIKGFIKQPTDAMLSKMVNEEGPDGKMTPSEVVSNAALLLVAGHDSTVNTISHCVLTLLRNPGSFELLRGRPELIPGAIEEVLRVESAVQFFPSRSATADIEIGGVVIPGGSQVHLLYGAANRDPKRFPNPSKFDPERRDNEHFGWGSGIHTCFGGPLARLEVNLALETFLRRVKNPRLVVDPPPYRQSNVFRGPSQLLVDFDGIQD